MNIKLKKYIPMLATIGGYDIQPPASLKPGFTGPGALAFTLSRVFTYILPLFGIIGFLFFLWSGFQYLTSKGDPKALAAAQARITYATIGLIIISLAYSLTSYATGLFGILKP